MTKERKAEVDYSRGHLHSHCGPTFHDDSYYCRHFIPSAGKIGTCEKVEGAIEPHMWCTRYVRAVKR